VSHQPLGVAHRRLEVLEVSGVGRSVVTTDEQLDRVDMSVDELTHESSKPASWSRTLDEIIASPCPAIRT
jgi:hypothetical protein